MSNRVLNDFFKNQIEEHLRVTEKCKSDLLKPFINVVDICCNSLKNKKKILFFGNGGSASDAQHLSTELTVRFSENRKPIPAISLSTDTSALTAIGNDFGFENIFSRQIDALGNPGDVALAITTSGKSKNIIKGLQIAKKKRLKCITFTGRNLSLISKFSDEIISIPSKNTSRIQEMHIMIGQMLCNAIEYKLKIASLIKEEE